MVADEVLVVDRIEEVAMANDRMAAWVKGENGRKQQPGSHVVGIVETHVDFPADHVLFLIELGFRQRRIENEIHQSFQKYRQRGARSVDVVNGSVEAGVGIPMATGGLHGIREDVTGEIPSALENHVLEKMRNAGAKVLVLVHGAGSYPDLGADHRCGGIRISRKSSDDDSARVSSSAS